MKSYNNRDTAEEGGRVAGAVQNIHLSLFGGKRQSDLFPQWVGGIFHSNDVKIRTFVQCNIFAFGNKNKVFVFGVNFLEFFYAFECNKVHPVLFLAKYSLCFNTYSHIFLFVCINVLSAPLILNRLANISIASAGI